MVVYTPDVLHAAFGVTEPRRLIEITYVAEPRTDAQLYFLRERDACSGGEFRMPAAVAASTDPRPEGHGGPVGGPGIRPRVGGASC